MINQKQMEVALTAMTEWLTQPQELGKAPVKIEYVTTFELHGLHYYIFKYKKMILSKWLLGVCGGYDGDELEHCGHIYSEMKEYNETTAVPQAIDMVEMIRNYWIEQAKKAKESKESPGTFAGFVLLLDNTWDKKQLINDLKDKWNLDVIEDDDKNKETLIFTIGNMIAAVSLIPTPIPDGEAEINAENNYMWPEALEKTRAHQAHLLVAVLGDEVDLIERGKLYTKLISACCKQKNILGIYTSGTVFEPQFYEAFAEMMKDDELPIFNWIYFGIYQGNNGVCAYTYGMNIFGKDEMEVLDAKANPFELRNFLSSLVAYVLENDVTLHGGETIGFSKNDKHLITWSAGVSLPGMTLKVAY